MGRDLSIFVPDAVPARRVDPARLVVVTAPTVEPWLVTDAEVLQHFKRDSDEDDTVVTAYLKAARIYFERMTGLALLQQTHRLEVNYAPLAAGLEIPMAPLLAVGTPTAKVINSVKYLDSDGAEQTLDASNYVDARPGIPGSFARLRLSSAGSWPDVGDFPGAFRVEFNAGFGATAASVPEDIRIAILWVAAWWYEARLPVNVGNIVNALPHHLEALLSSHRVAFIA